MVVIFAILILAWGTARFSILYPNNDFSKGNTTSPDQMLKRVLLVPSFQIFGELFMDSVEGARNDSEYDFRFSFLIQQTTDSKQNKVTSAKTPAIS